MKDTPEERADEIINIMSKRKERKHLFSKDKFQLAIDHINEMIGFHKVFNMPKEVEFNREVLKIIQAKRKQNDK